MARQITFYKYEVGIQSLEKAEDGRYDLIHTPVGTMEDTSLTKTDIRKFIAANGVECKRGMEVYAKKLARSWLRLPIPERSCRLMSSGNVPNPMDWSRGIYCSLSLHLSMSHVVNQVT